MAGLWQLLFLACLPVAVILAFSGQWLWAAIVFLIGSPLFWTLRNKAAMKAVMPAPRFTRETVAVPDRYEIPDEVRRKLSSTLLSDVPAAVRGGSPYDASTKDVEASLRKLGFLPPGTNYGVVYRVCFMHLMVQGEQPLHLRFGFVSTGHAPVGRDPVLAPPDEAWVLLTTSALRWHAVQDWVRGMPRRSDFDLIPPARDVLFDPTVSVGVSDVRSGPGGAPVLPIVVEHTFSYEPTEVWRHEVILGADAATDQLVADMRAAIETHRDV